MPDTEITVSWFDTGDQYMWMRVNVQGVKSALSAAPSRLETKARGMKGRSKNRPKRGYNSSR